MCKYGQNNPKQSVLNGQLKIANCHAIRWFKCTLKPPKMKKHVKMCNIIDFFFKNAYVTACISISITKSAMYNT